MPACILLDIILDFGIADDALLAKSSLFYSECSHVDSRYDFARPASHAFKLSPLALRERVPFTVAGILAGSQIAASRGKFTHAVPISASGVKRMCRWIFCALIRRQRARYAGARGHVRMIYAFAASRLIRRR